MFRNTGLVGLTLHRHYSSCSRTCSQESVAKVFRSKQDRKYGAYHHTYDLTRRIARGRIANVLPVENQFLVEQH